jgi:hypothetical protein
MRNIGLVLLTKKSEVFEGRIITEQFRNKPINELLHQKNSAFFEKIFIVHKDQRGNKAIEMLSAIELP